MSKWPTVPLEGKIDEVSTRKGDAPAEILSVTNTDGFVRSLDVFDKQVFSDDARNYKLVRYNELAYNPSRINVGSVARCNLPEGGAVSPMYTVVRCGEAVLPQYLLHFLKSETGRQHITHGCVGAVRFMLRFRDLERIRLPLPPVSEQERIVQILDEASNLLSLRERIDEKLGFLSTAIYSDLFGNPASNPRNWPVHTVGELIENGPQNGLYKHASFYGEGTRILRIDSFSGGEINDISALKRIRATPDEVQRYGLKAGDIVINRVNSPELLGKSVLIRDLHEPVLFESNMMRFSVLERRTHPVYVAYLLQTDLAKRHIASRAKRAIGQSSINQTDVKTLAIPLPPLPLQCEFVSRVTAARVLDNLCRESRKVLENMFQALLHRAFQGDL